MPVSYLNFRDYREAAEGFSGLSAFAFAPVSLSGAGEPRQLPAMLVTENYFDLLGVRAVAGRTFLADENRPGAGSPVAVLSHRLWSEQFGADPDVVGRTLTLNARAFTVIGVAPRGFKGTFTLGDPDVLWLPLETHPLVVGGPVGRFFAGRRGLFLNAFGRLAPGVPLQRAQAVLKTVAARLEREYPADNEAGR